MIWLRSIFKRFVIAGFIVFNLHFIIYRDFVNRNKILKMETDVLRFGKNVDSLAVENVRLRKEIERINYIELPETLSFCGEEAPLEKYIVRRKLENEIYATVKFRANRWRIDLYLSEAQFYFPIFDDSLAKDSLPTDLKYIAVVESEFDNSARSPMGAEGMWQFIPGTAKKRGLELSRYIDDRRDPEAAFAAARKELKSLREQLGNWFLVAAAYNAGLYRITSALEEQPHADSSYFDLFLPTETMDYIYRILAIKIVMENYKAYGFRDPPFRTEDVRIVEYVINERKKITDVVSELNVSITDFRFLNPRFNYIAKSEIPPGIYKMKIPKLKKNEIETKNEKLTDKVSDKKGPNP